MTWAKLDDHFPFHRKVRPISDAAFRLHVSAICWCCEHLTDGHVEHDEVALCSDVKKPATAVAELVKRGLWHETETGWVISCDWDMPRHRYITEPWRPRIPAELRCAVYDRDSWLCLHCESGQDLSLDHIHPFSVGGQDTMENLQTLCRLCNSRKGARI